MKLAGVNLCVARRTRALGRLASNSRRQAPSRVFSRLLPPSGTTHSVRCHAPSSSLFSPCHLAAYPVPADATLVTSLLLVFGIMGLVLMNPNTQHTNHIINHTYLVIIIWLNRNSHIHILKGFTMEIMSLPNNIYPYSFTTQTNHTTSQPILYFAHNDNNRNRHRKPYFYTHLIQTIT